MMPPRPATNESEILNINNPAVDIITPTQPEEPMIDVAIPPVQESEQPNMQETELDLLGEMEPKEEKASDAIDLLAIPNEPKPDEQLEPAKPAEHATEIGILDDLTKDVSPAQPPSMPESKSVTMAAELGDRAYLCNQWKNDMLEWRNRQQQLVTKNKEVSEKQSAVNELHEKIQKAKEELEQKQKQVKRRCKS